MSAAAILAQEGLTEAMRSVKKAFTEGGSWSVTIAVLGICVVLLVVTWWLTRRLEIRSGRAGTPQRLFREALDRLPLSQPQRAMLTTVAIAEGVEHPATLLLSRPVFDRCFDSWLDIKHRSKIDDRTKAQIRVVRELRACLFPPRS